MVTDIGRTGEWSPICRTCWWQDGEGAREGAWFYGRNEAGGNVWETDSQVAVAQRGREFAWLVRGKYARRPGADARIELRRSQAIAGIPVTLAAIKQIAKAPPPG